MENKLILNPSEDTLFYTAVNSTGNGAIWKFPISGTEASWIQLGNLEDVTTILYVDSTRLFIAARDSSESKPCIAMMEWGNPNPLWQNLRKWLTQYCYVNRGTALLSNDGQTIYSLFGQNR